MSIRKTADRPVKQNKFAWLLFLGVLPFDKGAFTLYTNRGAGDKISLALNIITVCCVALMFFLRPVYRDRIRTALSIKYIIYFGVLVITYALGTMEGESYTSRILSMGCVLGYYLLIIYVYSDIHQLFRDLYKATLLIILLSTVLYLLDWPEVMHIENSSSIVFKGIAANRNSYSEITMFFVAISFFLYRNEGRHRFWYLAGAIVAVYTTFISNGAASIICMLMLCVMLMLCDIPFFRMFYSLRAFMMVYVVMFLYLVVSHYTDTDLLASLLSTFGKDATFTGRTELWQMSMEVIWERPIFGRGYETTILNQMGSKLNDPHNAILYTLLTQGIVGVIAVIAMLATVFKDGSNQRLREDDAYLSMLVFVIAWMTRGLVESVISYSRFPFWCAIIVLELSARSIWAKQRGRLRRKEDTEV